MEDVLVIRTCDLCDLMKKISQGKATEEEKKEFEGRKKILKQKLKTENKVQNQKT